MSSGSDISAEIHAALIEAGQAVGRGGYTAILTRKAAETGAGAGTPWGAAATGLAPPEAIYSVTILDTGTKTRYARDPAGALIPRTVRTFMLSAITEAPQMGDVLTIDGAKHVISMIDALSPAGEALLFKVEIML